MARRLQENKLSLTSRKNYYLNEEFPAETKPSNNAELIKRLVRSVELGAQSKNLYLPARYKENNLIKMSDVININIYELEMRF